VSHPSWSACNDPGTEDFSWFDRLMFGMLLKIERFGWTGMYVLPEGSSPGWGYTIGLSERFDHPELVIAGLDDGSVAAIFADLATRVANHERIDDLPDARLELDGRPYRLVPVHPSHWKTDRFNMWVQYYGCLGEPYPPAVALQVQWADDVGRLPGDPEYDKRLRRRQPRLDRPALRQTRGRPRAA